MTTSTRRSVPKLITESVITSAYSADELQTLIEQAITMFGVFETWDSMALLRPQLVGRADLGQVSQQVRHALREKNS